MGPRGSGSRLTRRVATAARAGLLAAALAGCLDAPAVTPAPTPTREPEPTPEVTTYQLGTTVWYEGLQLHFDRATSELSARGGPVNVSLRVENTEPESSDLNAVISLVLGDLRVEATRESAVPSVPAGAVAGALLTFELQGVASADDAVLEIGASPDHVARVPLAAPAETTTFEPQALELEGSAAAGELRITLTSGLLRRDLPDWSQELVAGLLALTLTYDVAYTGSFAGGFAFTGENVALRLPNGSVIGARRDGRSQSVELIGPRKSKAGLVSRFEIPSDATGEFALLVRNGATERAIPFTLGE